ncbi:energy transducer TonB [Myxococcota bacterium]|nr:energy transducer TonB [Myxococcota bacterium]
MFDRLAHPRPAPRGRQAAALLLSVVVNSTLFTVLLVGGGQVVTEVQGQALAVEVTMVEEGREEGARLPAPPAGGQGRQDRAEPAEAAPAAASEDEGKPPGEETTPRVEEGLGAGDGGAAGGGGDGTGAGAGEGTGEGAGEGTGDGPGRVQTLAVEQVRPLRRVLPDFPASARALGLDSVRCVAEVEIDARGVPTRVQVSECPEIYRGAVQAAMLRWRFVPARVDGQPTAARFRQAIRFELRGG